MLLLDTNVLSEFRKIPIGRANPGVTRWADALDLSTCWVSVISIFELEFGIARLERRDPNQAGILRNWLERSVLTATMGRILPVTDVIARTAARLHVPDPGPFGDTLIAATAIVHGLTVVTRNTADFRSCSRFNPFA